VETNLVVLGRYLGTYENFDYLEDMSIAFYGVRFSNNSLSSYKEVYDEVWVDYDNGKLGIVDTDEVYDLITFLNKFY
jgi:cytochrome c2